MRRTLNVKLLAGLLVGAAVFAVGVHLLHGFQERRNASALLRQADRAEQDQQPQQAITYLKNYLGLMPRDTEVLARYGQALERAAVTPNARVHALLVLEQVLRREPQRHDIRRRVVNLAMHPMVGRFSDAREHLEILLREYTPDDPELEALLARCHAARGEFEPAAACYEKAIQHDSKKIENYVVLAELLRRKLDSARRANEVMDRLVAANPKAFQAFLARARHHQEAGRPEPAAADIARAGELAPDEAEVVLAVGGQAIARGEPEQARAGLERGLELHPRNAAFYLRLAELELSARRIPEATAVLRRGVAMLPDHDELRWTLANLLIQQGQEATEEIARLKQRGLPAAQQDFLQARLLMSQSHWQQAARLLERLQADLQPWPLLSRQASLYLAQCYAQLGNPDQQYAAYRRAVTADPLWEPGCLGLAAAQVALGRPEEALTTYRRILPHAPAARLPLARLLVAQNLRLPATQQRWEEIDRLLDEASREKTETLDAGLLRAEVLYAQGKAERAREVLIALRKDRPQEVEPWLALASLTDRQQQMDAALAVLDDAERQLGDRVELRVARAWLWSQRGGDEAGAALKRLVEQPHQFTAEDQGKLLRGLAGCQLRLGNTAEARRLWTKAAEQAPNDLGLKLVLFDLALQAGDDAAMQRWLKEVESIEGRDGSLWRYGQACRLIRQAREQQADTLEEARSLLAQAAQHRPGWSRVPLALADVAVLARDFPTAIKHYQRALELGDRSPQAMRPLVELLYQQRRYAEADEVMQKLPEREALAPDLQRLAATVSLQRQDPERALKLARQAVAADSKDYRECLWLGQVLAAAGQKEQAETMLRRAVSLNDAVPETWVTLILHLARQGRKDQAEALLRQARNKLVGDQFAAALAAAHEALGQAATAQELYARALTARPDDAALLRGVAGFSLRRGALAEAMLHLRKLLTLQAQAPDDAAWARRTLAVNLAAAGDYAQWQEALKLLGLREHGDLPRGDGENLDDQRARAVVLAAMKNRRQRQRAIGLLELIRDRQPLSAEEQFLLAQLHEAIGDWPKARQQFVQLLASHSRPRYLAHYIRSLQRHEDSTEAALWVEKLEKLPEAACTLLLAESKARWLVGKGQVREAVEVLQAYQRAEKSWPRDAGMRQSLVAGVLDQLSQATPKEALLTEAAEQAYRDLVAKQPERLLDQAAFLGRRGRTAEALELCEAAWEKFPAPVVAATSVAILRVEGASEEPRQRVADRIMGMVEKQPRFAAPLLVCLADLRDLQGRYADSERLYRQVLERDPRNLVALNNLAYLLALQNQKTEEALALLDRALAVGGPMPELIDTRALIRLRSGQPQQAISDLEEAVADAPGASLCYHLAQAHQLANNPTAAAAALRRAKSLGLQPDRLHALERATYQRLHAELEAR
ncbi:MAG: tetratricopeptide repeat protein [Planctomycetia bacterium]|nr:tetratricopeptide repeat protein [Planctomycetia bacterium]